MPLGDQTKIVEFACTCCTLARHPLPAWPGVKLLTLLTFLSRLGWFVELAPTVRLWCPTCATHRIPPPPTGGLA